MVSHHRPLHSGPPMMTYDGGSWSPREAVHCAACWFSGCAPGAAGGPIYRMPHLADSADAPALGGTVGAASLPSMGCSARGEDEGGCAPGCGSAYLPSISMSCCVRGEDGDGCGGAPGCGAPTMPSVTSYSTISSAIVIVTPILTGKGERGCYVEYSADKLLHHIVSDCDTYFHWFVDWFSGSG